MDAQWASCQAHFKRGTLGLRCIESAVQIAPALLSNIKRRNDFLHCQIQNGWYIYVSAREENCKVPFASRDITVSPPEV